MKKVLSISNIKLRSVNNKYNIGKKYSKKYKKNVSILVLTDEYKQFKEMISTYCQKVNIDPPYHVKIEMETYLDIDNPVKAILDGLSISGVIGNDKDILKLEVYKYKKKRNENGNLIIWVGNYGNGKAETSKE